MDEMLRKLELKMAAGDPVAAKQYFSAIMRDPHSYLEIESKARWKNQYYIPIYLQLLHHKGEIDLDNLWVCPIAYEPWQNEYGNLAPLMGIFPYELGMTYEGAMNELVKTGHEFTSYPEHYPDIEIYFLVADVRDVELATKVKSSMRGYGNQQLEEVPTRIDDAAQFYVLQGTAILRITREGMHIQEAHEVSLPIPADRETRKYYQRSDIDVIPDPRSWPASVSGPFYPFPRRERDSLLIAQPLIRRAGETYAVMIHMPTFRGFTLGSSYGVLEDDASYDLMVHAMRYNRQSDFGYSGGHGWPRWTDGIPKEEFICYWIAE